MLDFLDAVPAEYKPLALFIFIVVGAIGAHFTHKKGKQAGPEQKVTELYASGQFYDMGPVRELVSNTGLVYQQLIRLCVALEALGVNADSAAKAYAEHLEDQEKETEIQRRVTEALKAAGVTLPKP